MQFNILKNNKSIFIQYNKRSNMQLSIMLIIGCMGRLVRTLEAPSDCIQRMNTRYCCQVNYLKQLNQTIIKNCTLKTQAENNCTGINLKCPQEQLVAIQFQEQKCKDIYRGLYLQYSLSIQECLKTNLIAFYSLAGISIFFAFLPCIYEYFCCNCLRTVGRLKRKLNIINPTTSPSSYSSVKQYVISLLDTKTNKSKFLFWIDGKEQQTAITEVKILNQAVQFKTKLRIKGQDILGTWTAEGYIIGRADGIVFWMYKQYHNKERADQVGKKKYLIFQSSQIEQDQKKFEKIFGYWYYLGLQKNEKYNGPWTLSPKK